MAAHTTHDPHEHEHGNDCGHPGLKHDDHMDYLHDGHLHHARDGHIDEHEIGASNEKLASRTGGHRCDGHDSSHRREVACGHERHCDNHGRLEPA